MDDASIGCDGGGSPCQSDAYDGAYEVTVGGALFRAPNPSSLIDGIFDAGPVSLAGLNVSQQYYVAQQSATIRTLVTLQNPAGSAVTTPVELLIDLGSDGRTANVASSSGDTALTVDDRYLITDDDPVSGDPTNTSVFYGPGVVALRPAALIQTGPGRNGGAAEVLKATFNVMVPAGATRRLLFFGQLNHTAAEAQAAVIAFDTNPSPGSDLLRGLSNTQLTEVVNYNFGDAPPQASISGRITDSGGNAIAGVSVGLTGAQTATLITDALGNYSFQNLTAGGNYTVMPSFPNVAFTPPARSFENLSGNQTADFVGSPVLFTISGRLTDIAGNNLGGATVALSNDDTNQTLTTTTNAGGLYSFSVPAGSDYTVTPQLTNFTFEPSFRAFLNLSGNQTGNFVGTGAVSITGRIPNLAPGQSVTVVLSGTSSAVTTTDANGNFTFVNLPLGGAFTVTPVSGAQVFDPSSFSVGNLTANMTINFNAAPNPSPTPTPVINEDFGDAVRDAAKFSEGTLTQPPGATDPQVTVVQQNGQLVVTPRANITDASFNGYVTTNSVDFTNASASVEVVQTTDNGAQTIFAVG
ncbi:MAG: carboxypeptidase regulatory-like domain-containing protein, partial [Pyrinomonadaceae bacterium]